MIGFRQGKTVTISVDVVDSSEQPVSLVGASAVFAYKPVDDSADVVDYECDITDNTISYTLSASVTAELLGEYDYEIKLKDSLGVIDSLLVDNFIVLESIIPTSDKL